MVSFKYISRAGAIAVASFATLSMAVQHGFPQKLVSKFLPLETFQKEPDFNAINNDSIIGWEKQVRPGMTQEQFSRCVATSPQSPNFDKYLLDYRLLYRNLKAECDEALRHVANKEYFDCLDFIVADFKTAIRRQICVGTVNETSVNILLSDLATQLVSMTANSGLELDHSETLDALAQSVLGAEEDYGLQVFSETDRKKYNVARRHMKCARPNVEL